MRIAAAPAWPTHRLPALGLRREAQRPLAASPLRLDPPGADGAPKAPWEKKKEEEEEDRLSDPKLETMRLLLARLTGGRAKLLRAKDLQPKTKAEADDRRPAPPAVEIAEAAAAAAEHFAARRLDLRV
jgi:hypothetical protein